LIGAVVQRWGRRSLLRLEDQLRTRNASRLLAVARFCATAWRSSPLTRLAALEALAVALPRSSARRLVIQRALAIARAHLSQLLEPSSPVVVHTSILLKPYVSPREKGLLLVSFESELLKLASSPQFDRFAEEYRILFLPTWQPFFSTALFLLAARALDRFWILPSSTDNLADCDDLAPHARGLPFQACSWVDGDRHFAAPEQKTYDLLMVANFSKYKRHWLLFQALSELPPSISCAIAGRPLGRRTAESLRREAAAFGVLNRVEVIEDPDDGRLERLFAEARLFCALSHREGSYIAIAEALMADTPVAMFANAVVGSKEYINQATGFLFDPRERLSRQILRALRVCDRKRPREWARQRISARANGIRLNQLLEGDATVCSESWTADVEPFHCRHFHFLYYDRGAEARLTAAYSELRTRFGFDVRRPLIPVYKSFQ
jgi:glycosyltransferase involved in cell wall biosynthesis